MELPVTRGQGSAAALLVSMEKDVKKAATQGHSERTVGRFVSVKGMDLVTR